MDSKTDGTKQISVELGDAQLPAAVNAIAPLAIKHATGGHKMEGGHENKAGRPQLPLGKDSLLKDVPALTSDIKIEKVAVKADINAANYIERQQADVTVSGKDASGAAHELTLHLNAALSGYNDTTPDTVDLAGKQVQQLQKEKGFRGKSRE